MTVVDSNISRISLPEKHATTYGYVVPPPPSPPKVEAMPGLGWSQAVELPRTAVLATRPADARSAWVHRAPQEQVLALYRTACTGTRPPASPWWLRALAAGSIPSREAAFQVEDEVGRYLADRPGWVYVPWGQDGESGYWEFTPSEQPLAGKPNPTTVLHTDRHPGWIDVLPAHDEFLPEPGAVAGPGDLRARIEEFETVR